MNVQKTPCRHCGRLSRFGTAATPPNVCSRCKQSRYYCRICSGISQQPLVGNCCGACRSVLAQIQDAHDTPRSEEYERHVFRHPR